jgi:Fic family protein
MIRDHDRAIDSIFAFVAGGQPLSKGYVRELHKVLTAHQREVDAVDMEGNPIRVTLLRGEWKKWPNNPTRRQTGWLHEYCPPEQVDSEVDRLITWHRTHCERGVPPEVEAAWLHHRFTQIHPFQDGNGRVARCLATMVLLKGEGFPLVLTRDDRSDYVTALEMADAGDLVPLIKLFVLKQRSAFRRALGLSEAILTEHRQVGAILESARKTLRQRQAAQVAAFENVFAIADALHRLLVQRLEEIARELADVVKEENPGYSARSTHAAHGSERDHYHRFQIVQNARKVGYYANSNLYRAWAAVIIQTSVRTELLFSIHAPTHEPRGLLACAAMAYQRVRDEKDETRVDDVQPLHAELFEFTYLEEVESVKARFRTWLEECLVAGLEYWRRDL